MGWKDMKTSVFNRNNAAILIIQFISKLFMTCPIFLAYLFLVIADDTSPEDPVFYFQLNSIIINVMQMVVNLSPLTDWMFTLSPTVFSISFSAIFAALFSTYAWVMQHPAITPETRLLWGFGLYSLIGVLNILFYSYDTRQTALGLSMRYEVKVGVYNTANLIFKSSMLAVQIMIYGILYNRWEAPEDAAFYLCNLLAIIAVMYAAFAAVAFRGLEGVKKQKKEGQSMIKNALNQFKVFKNSETRDIALALQLRKQISFARLNGSLIIIFLMSVGLNSQTVGYFVSSVMFFKVLAGIANLFKYKYNWRNWVFASMIMIVTNVFIKCVCLISFWVVWKGIPLLNGISDPPSLDYLPFPVFMYLVFNSIQVFVTGMGDQILLECTQTEVPPAERGSVFAATNFICCTFLVVYGTITLLLPNPNLIYLFLIFSVLVADLWVLVLAFRVKKQVNRDMMNAEKSEVQGLMEDRTDEDYL